MSAIVFSNVTVPEAEAVARKLWPGWHDRAPEASAQAVREIAAGVATTTIRPTTTDREHVLVLLEQELRKGTR